MHVVHMLMIKSSSHFFNTFIDYKKIHSSVCQNFVL